MDGPALHADRRTFLRTPATTGTLALLGGLAGCLDRIRGARGEIRPESEPDEPLPTFECPDDDFEPHGAPYDESELRWGDTEEFALRVDDTSFDYGDTAEIRLTSGMTGNRNKWSLELLTTDGWRDVRGTVDEDDRRLLDYTDEGVGGSFAWNLTLTEPGILSESHHGDRMTVCPDLVSGRYRFVFWGLIGGAVAVAFDLEV
ncbi:hypothetical protein JCM17823_24520 [Halorubrum gandharaense]